jgi:importin-7
MLLSVAAGDPAAPAEASHVAATVFKNAVRRGWDPPLGEEEAPARVSVSPADKAAVRAGLLAGLAVAARPVQAQLVEAVRVVAYNDWPEAWPDLAPALAAVVEEGCAGVAGTGVVTAPPPPGTPSSVAGCPARTARLHAALLACRVLARQYEFRDGERRAPLLGLASGLYPGLLRLGSALCATWSPASADPMTGELLKLVLKCLWSALYMGVPPAWLVPAGVGDGGGSGDGGGNGNGPPTPASPPALPPGQPLDPSAPAAAWLALVHAVLTRPVPEPQPASLDDRPEWPWWKAKKWALHIAGRVAGRYGDPKRTRAGSTDRAFAGAWVAGPAPAAFLDAHLALLAAPSHGGYATPRATNLALQYLAAAVPSPSSWKGLKPHVPAVLAAAALPAACFDDADAELWADDPADFVRKGNDVMEELYSPKVREWTGRRKKKGRGFFEARERVFRVSPSPHAFLTHLTRPNTRTTPNHQAAAVNFVHELCRVRPKAGLPPVMALLSSVFAEAEAAGVAGTPPPLARRLDGALLLTGALAPVLKRKAPYRDQVPALVSRVILPLFTSPHGHLRAKAAWAGSTFADAPLGGGPGGDEPGCGPTFDALFAATAGALADPDLPVRVDAATALRSLVDALDEERVPAFAAGLPTLLRPLLAVLSELDSEDVLSSLEALVDKVGPAIAPYASELTAQLVGAYNRMVGPARAGTGSAGVLIAAGGGGGGGPGSPPGAALTTAAAASDAGSDDGDDAAMAAYGVLRALLTILDAVSGLPGAVAALAPSLTPLLASMLTPAVPTEDTFEEALDLLAYLTYFAPDLTPPMWALFPRVVACYHAWAVDYLDAVATALANFMSRGTATFVAGGPAPADVLAAVAGTSPLAETVAASPGGVPHLPGGPSYADAVLGIAERALVGEAAEDSREEDAGAAPRLLTTPLLATAGRGLPASALDRAVGLALARLPTASGSALRSRLVCVVAAALHADAGAALAALAARGATAPFFSGWVAMAAERKAGKRVKGADAPAAPGRLRHFKAAQDKRVCVLGLAAALAAPAGAVPPELEAGGGPALLSAALSLLAAWRSQTDGSGSGSDTDDDAARAFGWGASGSEAESDEEDSGGACGKAGDDDDDGDGDDDAFLRRLAARAGRRAPGGDDSSDASWSDDDDGWSGGEEEVDTPATAVDPGAVLLEAVDRCRQAAPARLAGADGLAADLAAAREGVAAAARTAAEKAAAKAAKGGGG